MADGYNPRTITPRTVVVSPAPVPIQGPAGSVVTSYSTAPTTWEIVRPTAQESAAAIRDAAAEGGGMQSAAMWVGGELGVSDYALIIVVYGALLWVAYRTVKER